MTAAARLTALFVAEDEERVRPPSAVAQVMAPLAGAGARVCVLGGERAGERFAAALAARLARLPGARCAVLCGAPRDDLPASVRPAVPPGVAARRTARGLAVAGHAVRVRGRVVELELPGGPASVEDVLADVVRWSAGAPTVTVLPGVRRPEVDRVVAAQDLVIVVVPAESPPSLATLAVGELGAVAPGAVIQAVPLPPRLGAAARRAAVGRALEALR